MTFSVTRDNGAFEWAGKNPLTVFCQPSNLFRKGMWRMLRDVMIFNRRATVDVENHFANVDPHMSLGDYLSRGGYGEEFLNDYILVSLLLGGWLHFHRSTPAHDRMHLWVAMTNHYPPKELSLTFASGSTPPNVCALDFPARSQLRFMYNHHLLQIIGKPPWLTIQGGRSVLLSVKYCHEMLTYHYQQTLR